MNFYGEFRDALSGGFFLSMCRRKDRVHAKEGRTLREDVLLPSKHLP